MSKSFSTEHVGVCFGHKGTAADDRDGLFIGDGIDGNVGHIGAKRVARRTDIGQLPRLVGYFQHQLCNEITQVDIISGVVVRIARSDAMVGVVAFDGLTKGTQTFLGGGFSCVFLVVLEFGQDDGGQDAEDGDDDL